MGTEYSKNTFMAAGSPDDVRSEVSVGRAMIPVAFNLNDSFIIGGSADFVWAGMDVKMALDGMSFFDMILYDDTMYDDGGLFDSTTQLLAKQVVLWFKDLV
jgi:long-chain fatty acid transport protein